VPHRERPLVSQRDSQPEFSLDLFFDRDDEVYELHRVELAVFTVQDGVG
jgi:hypothetical protein